MKTRKCGIKEKIWCLDCQLQIESKPSNSLVRAHIRQHKAQGREDALCPGHAGWPFQSWPRVLDKQRADVVRTDHSWRDASLGRARGLPLQCPAPCCRPLQCPGCDPQPLQQFGTSQASEEKERWLHPAAPGLPSRCPAHQATKDRYHQTINNKEDSEDREGQDQGEDLDCQLQIKSKPSNSLVRAHIRQLEARGERTLYARVTPAGLYRVGLE